MLRPLSRQLGQQQGIPPEVGVHDDFVPLVVMPQDQHPVPERLLGGPGPVEEFLGRDRLVIGERKCLGFNGIHARTSCSGDSILINGLLLCSILRFAQDRLTSISRV